MRILLINQAYAPDKVASSVYLTEYAEYLASQGNEVTVLASRISYLDRHTIYPHEDSINGVRVIRVGSVVLLREDRLARILNALFLNVSFAWKLIRLKRFDRIIAMTSPPLIGFIAAVFCCIKRSPLTYWLMDINPDQAIQAGWIRQRSTRAYILQKVLKFTLKRSDSIIVLDRYMKQKISEKQIDPDKIRVHSLWPNSAGSRQYVSKTELKRRMGLEGKFVVLYAGNHSICHPLDTLLECAQKIAADESIAFVFVGRGARVRDVTEFRQSRKLTNVFQFDYQDSWQETLYLGDMHAITMGNEYEGLVHPCKIYNILTTGTPFIFIGSKSTHIADLIRDRGIGMRVDHGESRKAVEYIRRVKGFSSEQSTAYFAGIKSAAEIFEAGQQMKAMTADAIGTMP